MLSIIVMPVIALDLGGTKLAGGIMSDKGDLVYSTSSLLESRKGREVGQLIIQTVSDLLHRAGNMGKTPASLGICVPGIVHVKTGRIWAPNIPGWEDYPLSEELQRGLDNKIKISVDSDRACYILGEAWKGNARGCLDAIYLSVGTGIGAGIMVNGKVLRGANDIAGAIGWMALSLPFHEKYRPCGCFEYNASGEGLVRVARDLIAEDRGSASKLANMNPQQLNAKLILEAHDRGDELAIHVLQNAIKYWGMAVSNLVSLFNPEKIIFGGGLFGPAIQYLDEIYAEAKNWAQPISIQQVRLEGSALGSDAGLFGAGFLALKEF